MQPDVQRCGTTIAALEMRGERLHQARQHERERLESLNRPFQIERLLETFFRYGRHQRRRILTTREPLPCNTHLSESGRHFVGGQCREIAEGAETPAS